MKICKNCKYFDPRHISLSLNPYCTKHMYERQDHISGKINQLGIVYADMEREPNDSKLLRYIKAFLSFDKRYLEKRCGPEAIYYEAK